MFDFFFKCLHQLNMLKMSYDQTCLIYLFVLIVVKPDVTFFSQFKVPVASGASNVAQLLVNIWHYFCIKGATICINLVLRKCLYCINCLFL